MSTLPPVPSSEPALPPRAVPQMPIEDLDLIEILKSRLERLDNVPEIDQLTQLIIKLRREQQDLALARIKGLEELQRSRFETRLGYVRQITSLIISVVLAIGGPIVFFKVDDITGAFMTSVGFTSLGLSSDLVRAFFDRYNAKR